MSEVSGCHSSMTLSLATEAVLLERARIVEEIDVALLAKTLDFQEEIAAELLKAMGIGQNVDTLA